MRTVGTRVDVPVSEPSSQKPWRTRCRELQRIQRRSPEYKGQFGERCSDAFRTPSIFDPLATWSSCLPCTAGNILSAGSLVHGDIRASRRQYLVQLVQERPESLCRHRC